MLCRHRPIVLVVPAAGAVLALLAAGCGGGGSSPGVASVASSTTAATTATTQSDSGLQEKSLGGGPGPGAHFKIAMNAGNATQGAEFSACMRKHGVTNFPDPNSKGVITFGSGTGIDPSSPAFRSARDACQKLLPNGGQPTPQQLAQMQAKLLAFSKCMRAHGIEDFPDPSNGGLRLRGGPGSDLDLNDPRFQAAQQACQHYMPKIGGPGGPGK